MNKFIAQFKKICAEIDKIDNIESLRPAEPEKVETGDGIVRYNIHQRSLPVGLDKPVAFFLRREEAEILLKMLKSKKLDNGSVIYYDMVLNTGEGGNVFPTGGELIIERGFNFEEPAEEKPADVQWAG